MITVPKGQRKVYVIMRNKPENDSIKDNPLSKIASLYSNLEQKNDLKQIKHDIADRFHEETPQRFM